MSDPVTTAEVEDVLSSIRRLVSEEKRPLHADETPKQAERLVLTPALRVQENQPVKEGVASDIQAAFHTERSEGEASDDLSAYGTSDVADDGSSQPIDLAAHTQQPKAAEVLNLTSADLADDYSDDPYQFDENDTDNDAAAITPLPPLTLQPEARSDADWAADALAEAEAVAESVKVAEIVETPDVTVDEPVSEGAAVAVTKAATLSAKIEALESAIGGIDDNFEPDEVSDDAYSGTHAPALAWEDDLDNVDLDEGATPTKEEVFATDLAHDALDDMAAEVEEADPDMASDKAKDIADDTVRELHQPLQEAVLAAAATGALAEKQGAAEADFELASETRVLDEDALRDMVGDIVRSELQGALGERITRNVRKLVRREIHRALTTQDLD